MGSYFYLSPKGPIKILTTNIYYEHIEEASFLYDQRKNCITDPDADLVYQSEIEERLEAHIDALEIGGKACRPIVDQSLNSDDEGEYFCAIYSIIRMGEDECKYILELLESEEILFPDAVVAAFRLFGPIKIASVLQAWLSSKSDTLQKISLEVLGSRAFSELIEQYQQLSGGSNDPVIQTLAIRAIMKIDPGKVRQAAYQILMSGADYTPLLNVCFEVLYILNDQKVFEVAKDYCESGSVVPEAAVIILGLADKLDIALLQKMTAGNITRSLFQAIGFTGNLNLLSSLLPLDDNSDYSLLLNEAAHIMLGVEAPEFVDMPDLTPDFTDEEKNFLEIDDDETEINFSLREAIASFDKTKNSKQTRVLLGRPFEEQQKIMIDIASIYRKWLYLLHFHLVDQKAVGIDITDLAESQLKFISNQSI